LIIVQIDTALDQQSIYRIKYSLSCVDKQKRNKMHNKWK